MSDRIQSTETFEEVSTEQEAPAQAAAKWYIVHTITGYENKVKSDLEKVVENRGLQDLIQELYITMEETTEIKNGKRKVVSHKMMPSYVAIKMVHNPATWYIVRNTHGVTGFVGADSRDPQPLTDAEVEHLMKPVSTVKADFEVGQRVRVLSGSLADMLGDIQSVDTEAQKVRVAVTMFGRETPVDLDYIQVELVEE